MSSDAKLKDAFKDSDLNGDGLLSFDEFFELLKTGDPEFPEDEAETLFKAADKDASGAIDFNEFVDYIFDNKDFGCFVESRQGSKRPADADEEEDAKKLVLGVCVQVRNAASKAIRKEGGDWSKLTWKQRLEVVREREKSGVAADIQLNHAKTTKVLKFEEPEVDMDDEKKPSSHPTFAHAKTTPLIHAEEDDQKQPDSVKRDLSDSVGISSSKSVSSRKSGVSAAAMAIAEKTQEELVDYSIHKYDLNFAGRDPDATQTLLKFKEGLKTAGGPEEIVDIQKYIAKGTAGWVFLAERKSSGSQVAMKLIRMTQALSGVKEWYISKVLRRAGVKNIVYTDEMVCVLARDDAPPIIEEQLIDAGPVPYYMCLLQDFMNGGTLEGLAEKNKLPPRTMFAALEDVATTLSVMHEKSIHHKDVKPENVLVEMDGGELSAAKLCDFGSAEFGNGAVGRADDTRRFGVTLFSLATGEGWTKNRLIREKHDALVERLRKSVESAKQEAMRALPDVLQQILSGTLKMVQVAELMAELKDSCKT